MIAAPLSHSVPSESTSCITALITATWIARRTSSLSLAASAWEPSDSHSEPESELSLSQPSDSHSEPELEPSLSQPSFVICGDASD